MYKVSLTQITVVHIELKLRSNLTLILDLLLVSVSIDTIKDINIPKLKCPCTLFY